MLKTKNKLTILHESSSTFTDYSIEALDFLRDSFSFTFLSSDSVYIGFYKPISRAYIELSTANTNSGALSLSYYNGSSFTSIDSFVDETSGLNRSGFLSWDRNLTDEAKTTVNSTELYWYKLEIDSSSTAITFMGINIVFSDDSDLEKDFPEVLDYKPSSATSMIGYHVSARDEIIQRLRAQGKWKLDLSNGIPKDITAFDLLDISQVNQASKYLTLAKIFLNISDAPDDSYREKYEEYKNLFSMSMDTFYLDLDLDDDGEQDYEERMRSNNPVVMRR